MRIVVAGIGGVGGYIGAHLCKLEDEVIFLARGNHAERIRETGLLVKEDEGEFTARPDSVVSTEALEGEIDLLLLCVKSYDLKAVLVDLSSNITSSTIIVPFANGVEHKEKIASLVDAKVL
ncbi:MAG: 2-dehydropantoate 2-reductase, partial [Sulfurimonadaceae bacterium]